MLKLVVRCLCKYQQHTGHYCICCKILQAQLRQLQVVYHQDGMMTSGWSQFPCTCTWHRALLIFLVFNSWFQKKFEYLISWSALPTKIFAWNIFVLNFSKSQFFTKWHMFFLQLPNHKLPYSWTETSLVKILHSGPTHGSVQFDRAGYTVRRSTQQTKPNAGKSTLKIAL